MRSATVRAIEMNGEKLEYRLVASKTAKWLRVRVGLDGVEVIKPAVRTPEEADGFLGRNQEWILEQLSRVKRLRVVRKPSRESAGEIMFRGVPTPVRIEHSARRQGQNRVLFDGSALIVRRSHGSKTTTVQSLENWFRKQARFEINQYLTTVTQKLKRSPNRLYIMGQRTKWGNCSPLRNLSFSWRLIMVPELVLKYLVTHEAAHLAVPDHSSRFWLTVQSLCPESERAKQWLTRNGKKLPFNLNEVVRDQYH